MKTGNRPAKSTATRHYGAETYELILAAAQRLFASRGLQAVSMTDIATEAGVSRATVFNQFGSKPLVLDAITARSLSSYRDLLAAALADQDSSTPELLRRLFAQMARGLEANRALYREVFAEIRKMSMGLEDGGLSPDLHREAFGLLTQLFARGQKRGDIADRTSPEVLATAFDSLLSGAVTQWLHGPARSKLAPMLAALIDVLLGGVEASR